MCTVSALFVLKQEMLLKYVIYIEHCSNIRSTIEIMYSRDLGVSEADRARSHHD